jgi:hypothetical protein
MNTNIITQDNLKDIATFSIIRSKIYEIRGQKVILDYDLADMYGTETKVLKQSVRRNIERFPSDFMLELTREEYNSLRSQIVTLKNGGRGKYSKYEPFAFTEQGVAMLSTVLNSKYAIELNINIIRTFIALRQYALGYAELKQDLEKFKTETKIQIVDICELLDELISQKRELEKPYTPIGFKTSFS